MSEPLVLTIDETAELLRISRWTVGSMTRDGRLPRVPGLRRTRIPTRAVLALMEAYDGPREPGGNAPAEAPTPRRRHRRQAQGSVEGEAVGSGGPLHRPIGQTSGDVVVRVVARGGG